MIFTQYESWLGLPWQSQRKSHRFSQHLQSNSIIVNCAILICNRFINRRRCSIQYSLIVTMCTENITKESSFFWTIMTVRTHCTSTTRSIRMLLEILKINMIHKLTNMSVYKCTYLCRTQYLGIVMLQKSRSKCLHIVSNPSPIRRRTCYIGWSEFGCRRSS